MAKYRIVKVESKRDLKKFIKFPHKLYKDCPQYVPALDSGQVHDLTKSSSLKHCTTQMWIVLDGDEVVGRLHAIINPVYNNKHNKKRVRFGWFDAINDVEVAKLLFETAEKWAKEHGMTEIHGPLYYNNLGKQGMLFEGYENTPPFNCIYNYPYYNELMEKLGYVKEYDWIQYKVRADQPIPDKIARITDRLMERYNLKIIDVEELAKDKVLVHKFFRTYSDSFQDVVYNFIPFTDEEIEDHAAQIVAHLRNEYCCIIMDEDNEVAAFGVGFPSLSEAFKKMKGKIFPFGWWHFRKAFKNNELADLMLTGAAPKWQNTGISAIYHAKMSETYIKAGVKWAVTNPQIDTNVAINVWDRYDEKEVYMRRRCYIKSVK